MDLRGQPLGFRNIIWSTDLQACGILLSDIL